MADSENRKTLEESFAELEATITELEKDNVSLEDAFSFYEKGMKLVASCEAEIDKVEKKVLEISGGTVHEFS